MPVTIAKPVVTGNHLSKKYADVYAIKDVDIHINKGEVVALLGPNGAGKTTLTNLLLGRLLPNSGSCQVFNNNPRKITIRQKMGVMLQVSDVPATLTVSEHIDCFRQYYPKPLALPQILQMAGLVDIASKRFGQLSGGQKQRVLFAIAICGNADLLFLDEPTVGLDVEARRQFWKVIKELKSQGVSVLLTTHYLEEADALADRIYVLSKGKIIAKGSPQEIKKNSAGKVIHCCTKIPLSILENHPDILSVSKQGNRLEVRSKSVEKTLLFMLQEDESLYDLSVLDTSLEQAFLDIVETNLSAEGA